MDNLIDNLISRWEKAFDDIHNLPAFKAQVKTTLYAPGTRYNLEKYDQHSFPSNGALSNEKDDYEYGFNDQGLPCYMTFGNEAIKTLWEGYYKYTDNLADYIEFNINTGVPSALTRITFENGRKITSQRLGINGKGTICKPNQSREELIKEYKENDLFFFLITTTFEYDADGRIIRSVSNNVAPGLGKYSSYDEYTYTDNQLDKIRTFHEGGSNRLTYSRNRENLSQDELIEKLAQAMAQSIVSSLTHHETTSPLALLEINYHYADNYFPLLVSQSQQEVEQRLENGGEVFFHDKYDDSSPLDITSFEDYFAQMEQLMEEQDNWDIGRIALRRTAAILTETKLLGKIKTTTDFAAYAVDWTVEGGREDLEEILLECGVKPETLDLWKEKKFITE